MDYRNQIIDKCQELEKENKFTILFAIESGSRLWGMESCDSDYDVHLVYYYTLEDYMSLSKPRDTVSWMSKDRMIDINGFDIYKYTKLLLQSNPNMIDWTLSPIIYYGTKEQIPSMMDFAINSFNPFTLYHYYYGIAESALNLMLKRGKSSKKYLYVLRGLLNAKWLLDEKTLPPYEFKKLVTTLQLETEIKEVILQLLERKRKGSEIELIGDEFNILTPFIEKQFSLRDVNKDQLIMRNPSKEHLVKFNKEIKKIIGF
ncbi:MAG: DNA polymerase beta superfamily protein [Candidatus Thorarchaeota archaeon]